MKLTHWAILSNVLAIGLIGVRAYDDDDDKEERYEESYDSGYEEFHYTFERCDGKDEGSCKDGRATVENIQEFMTKDYEKDETANSGTASKFLEGRTEEQNKIAGMSHDQLQVDREEYIWPHQQYKKDPSGCGYPLCVLDDQRPERMRSLCKLMKWIKDDGSKEFRPFHFQKGDCVNAIAGKGHDWEWGKRPSNCDNFGNENPKYNIPLCLVDVKKAVAIHFDNPCKAMEYMSFRKKSVHMYVITGDRAHSDQCYSLLKNKRTYLKTEWFDIDDPCVYGDMESATQTYHYVKGYPLTDTFRFCGSQYRKQEIAITTILGQSRRDAQREGQITESTLKNGGEFVCLNEDQRKKPPPPDYWFTRKILCKDYRIQFKCSCFFGCKKREKKVTYEELSWKGWRVRVPEIPHLFSECTWNPYVNTDAGTTIMDDVEVRSSMLWGRKEGSDLKVEGDFKAFKEHACGDGHFDAMYIDSRRIKDSMPASETGELITKNTPFYGFLCFAKNQEDENKPCSNYKVRFCCKKQMQAMWGEWGAWDTCSVTCGRGYKTRKRVCDNNSDSTSCFGVKVDDKRDPKGRPIQEEPTCCVNPCPQKVYVVWSDWSAIGECSVTCGDKGTQEFRRRCETKCDKDQCSEDACPSRVKNPELYKKTDKCRKQPCPFCDWDEWSRWSKCSVTCDKGTHSRTRKCVDYNNNYKECDIQKCRDYGGEESAVGYCVEQETCPVDFYWECWNNWSPCSVLCGKGGKQQRQRYCIDGHSGGKKCAQKKLEEERECSGNGECPSNCLWGQWGGWSSCSVTCVDPNSGRLTAMGGKVRKRRILKEAKNGGKECDPGDKEQGEVCHIREPPCANPCVWGEWNAWEGHCPLCFSFNRDKKRCQQGSLKLKRIRKAKTASGQNHGWSECKCSEGTAKEKGDCFDGEDKQEESCDCGVDMCKADQCMWAEWGSWSDCQSNDCGSRGKMYKKRKCMYMSNGFPEEGDRVDCRDRKACKNLVDMADKDDKIVGEVTYALCPNLCSHLSWTQWEDWGSCSETCGKGIRIRSRQCNGVGKDEMTPETIKSFCPRGAKNGREKEEEPCDLGSCDGKPDCPKYDGGCKIYEKEYNRRQRRKNRRKQRKRRNRRRRT